jgi:hypothetical protein
MEPKLLGNAKRLSLGLVLMLAPAAPAVAQGLELSFGKHSGHGAFGISFSVPFEAAYRPDVRAEPRRMWVPGRYETVEQHVWVEGGERREWIPARYETRHDECGRPTSVLVRQGYWKTASEPGHFERRAVQVWVDGYWRVEPAIYAAPRYGGYACERG